MENPLLEESFETTRCPEEAKRHSDDSGDQTYDSQLSLEEVGCSTSKFSRDALGRQSMSEKRHAALDAKTTDTYKRNKKLREKDENVKKSLVAASSSGAASALSGNVVEITAPKEFKSSDNKVSPSPRKTWLVDDHQGTTCQGQQSMRDEREGFASRGDVKQASLNSALDDRYKRSRKKGGIRSMLRLGKNRKSLNFGDNIDANNYCSGTINYIA